MGNSCGDILSQLISLYSGYVKGGRNPYRNLLQSVYIIRIFFGDFFIVAWVFFINPIKKCRLFSTILYISSGYYLSDAYIRSAVGELIGLSFLPLAIAFVQDVAIKTKVSKRISISGILAVSDIIKSHVLTCFFLLLFCLWLAWIVQHSHVTIKKVYCFFWYSLCCLSLNANFLFPFLFFYKNVPRFIDYVDKFFSIWLADIRIYGGFCCYGIFG